MNAPIWDAVLDEIRREIHRRGTQPLHLQAPARPDEILVDPYRRLQGLLERLTRAERQLELAPLPAGDTSWGEEVRPGNKEHNLRKSAVRARLELLGYAPGAEGDSSTLRQAVRQFQQDAQIDVDGWVGRQTWEALDEFITLEPPLQLERWYPSGGSPCPALVRATALRLRMLGFEATPTDREELLAEPLAAFRRAARELGLPAGAEVPERQVVALLFDDELLLSIAARGLEGQTVLGPQDLETPEADATSRMLRRMVRNELWLQGYEVGDLRVSTQVAPGQKGLADGLRVYWSHRALPPGETIERRSKLIDVTLFAALQQDQGALTGDDAKAHEHVSSFVASHLEEFRQAWEHTIPCRPVFFIWDGVKRGARWLQKQIAGLSSLAEVVSKGVEYAKAFVWNMVRYVFQQGSKIFSTVRRAVAALIHGVQPFLDGSIRVGQGLGRVECQIALNGSLGVFIGSQASPSAADTLAARLEQMSQCLSASSLIFAEILRAELKLLKGPIGWMALLSHLVKDAPRWQSYLAQVAELPDHPDPTATLQFQTEAALEPPPQRNWLRRLVILAAGVLVVSGTGLVAWQVGALSRPTSSAEWLQLVGVILGLPILGGLAAWVVRKWLRSRLGL
ncbi:peptidoglycan-binding domain-containing protein [Hyalangium sp.]|uniref:peptidoglycan-binding domain-containing protein n=1 Tax=Hyalangium sp. TaxID=2028555 RepID=UPI002D58D752|nr:peptidoglycan-binding domain-containing protein [Hyalangium sp.]HYI02219.1 peptidoglycan-binding domain-containing protein [Hyalangium sp.]